MGQRHKKSNVKMNVGPMKILRRARASLRIEDIWKSSEEEEKATPRTPDRGPGKKEIQPYLEIRAIHLSPMATSPLSLQVL